MKKYLLLFAMACTMVLATAVSFAGGDKVSSDDPLRKSVISEPNPFIYNTSFPRVFNQPTNAVTLPAVSTGYYFIDSDDEAPDYWRPNPEIIDTTFENNLWRRINSGPRIVDRQYWIDNPEDGLRFFRNPAYPVPSGDFWNGNTDSTDDAIAGPIPIGFDFIFNGLRYDSFYVSTNGIIALTNRRYFYDGTGQRTILPSNTDCYDPMSADWFARSRTGDGLSDPTPDDYGYNFSVLANSPTSPTRGIRQRGGPLDQSDFSSYRTAVIAPFFGDMHLSQFNPNMNVPENWGKVQFKRSNANDKIIIYFMNIAPKGGLNTPYGGYTGPTNARPGDQNYIAASAQVILNKRDSSVTIVYERFDGVAIVSGRGVPANTVFRYNTTVGVSGYARHVNFGQPSYNPNIPWAAEYIQTTHYFSNYSNPQKSDRSHVVL